MPTKNKQYVLIVADLIYLNVCEIKKKNPEFSNINAIENNNATYESTSPSNITQGTSLGGPVENLRVDALDVEESKTQTPIHTLDEIQFDVQERGACCIILGDKASCVSDTTKAECDILNGEFFKDKTLNQ